MTINELLQYVNNNNQFNEPFSILNSSVITNDQLRLDYKDGQYLVYMTNEKASPEGIQTFDNEYKAIQSFKIRWDAGLRAAERKYL